MKPRGNGMKYPNIIQPSDFGPIIVSKNDTIISRTITQNGYWAGDDIQLIGKILEYQLTTKERVVFYDIGSNIGTHTLALGSLFRNRIMIRAFEAQRQIYYMLCGTVALNNLSNTFCHHNAVSNISDEPLDIMLPDYSANNNFGALELRPPKHSDNQNMVYRERETVKTITVDHFKEAIDFIKLDIEGMEDAALRGATQSIDQHRPACLIEMHKTDAAFVLEFFKSRNYSAWMKSENLIALPSEMNVTLNGINRLY